MGVPARRLPVSEVRRAQITSATIAVLARRGFAGTSYDAICRQAGLSSKRLISYHFADKEELLATVARVVREEEAAFVRRAASGVSGVRERLSAYIRGRLDFAAARPERVRALRQIVCNTSETGSDGWPAELFAEGQREGAFRAFDAEVMSAALRGSIEALALSDDPRAGADELVRAFDLATRPF
ncbi:TetR family transcriptional regulator [Nonomuraea sp. NPDC049421]|uniref:TetR/AcrR family transcriptional regulator n=1 Tax=Nonomuraea sp. NPDC049421 TaxID=3155275 RepID=UPI003413A909